MKEVIGSKCIFISKVLVKIILVVLRILKKWDMAQNMVKEINSPSKRGMHG